LLFGPVGGSTTEQRDAWTAQARQLLQRSS
jgi:hypothetical protein